MNIAAHDLLGYLSPDTLWGAIAYLALFVLVALVLTRLLRTVVQDALIRRGHMDRTTMSFLMQFGSAIVWVVLLILYAHLIPVLRSVGTALLAGASVASVVIGLAAQSTLGNLVAGISITIYRPFRLGDTLQVSAPTGQDIGVVELISLGYTTLRAADGHLIVLPNAIAASQVTLNLSSAGYAPWPLMLTLRLPPDADVESARQLALQVAKDKVGEQGVTGCYLTKIDASVRTLELRLQAKDGAAREQLRSQLLGELSRRFSESKIGSPTGELPAFA